MSTSPNPNLAHLFLDLRIEQGLGQKTALLTDDGPWSYQEVYERSLHDAQELAQLGVQREDRVLICLPDSAAWVTSFFAILRSGAVVVMANPSLPPQALAELAAYTRAKVVIGLEQRWDEQTLLALESSYTKQSLPTPRTLIPKTPAQAKTPPAHYCVKVNPHESAIWLFSGGTTGTPKAVRQSHASFAFTTRAYAHEILGLSKDDVTISVPKLFFGYATGSNLLFPFSVGATSVLTEKPCKAKELAALISQSKATVLVHVPTMIAKMLAEPSISRQALSSLRLCTSAGEALPASVHQKWLDRFGVEVLDGLGTAEMWHIFLTNRPGHARAGTLGTVVPGFEVRLCSENGEPVEQGEPGWLWVRGGALAQGYWLRPDQDTQAFYGEWYRSGDLLRQDKDGHYHYCGRGGDLMKVSGKWLAPADVENVLMSHPAIASAVVVGATDAQGLQKPYAFVTLTEIGATSFDETQVRQFVADELEPYKSPRAVYVAKHWPRTHLGKANRKILRAMVAAIRAGELKVGPGVDTSEFQLTSRDQPS